MYAGSKVVYDKIIDYIKYYLLWQNDNDAIEDNLDQSDSIMEYDNLLKIEKYNDEKKNKRILPEVSFYHEYATFFSLPTYIIDNIYLGSAFNAASYNTLKDLNIKVIFNITKEISNYFPNDFIYVRCNLYDNNKHSISKYLEKIYQDIKYYQEYIDGNILIHCYMGASRSAIVIIYYLMKKQKHENGNLFTFDDALNFVKSRRSIINPTFRFTKDLAKSIIKN